MYENKGFDGGKEGVDGSGRENNTRDFNFLWKIENRKQEKRNLCNI